MLNEKEYLLICLIEECAEVSHRATKALRFGLDEVEPHQPLNNQNRLRGEIHDLVAVIDLLAALGVGRMNVLDQSVIGAKKDKVRKFMAYSRTLEILETPPPLKP